LKVARKSDVDLSEVQQSEVHQTEATNDSDIDLPQVQESRVCQLEVARKSDIDPSEVQQSEVCQSEATVDLLEVQESEGNQLEVAMESDSGDELVDGVDDGVRQSSTPDENMRATVESDSGDELGDGVDDGVRQSSSADNNVRATVGHYCFYCDTLQTNVKGHWLRKHAREWEVKFIRACTEPRARLALIYKLRSMGDTRHYFHCPVSDNECTLTHESDAVHHTQSSVDDLSAAVAVTTDRGQCEHAPTFVDAEHTSDQITTEQHDTEDDERKPGHSTVSQSLQVQQVEDITSSVVDSEPCQRANSHKHRSKLPMRPCPYCGKMMVRLTRHLRRMHADVAAVADAARLGPKAQRQIFTQQKRLGINKYNLDNVGKRDFVLLRERATKDHKFENAIVCDMCSGVFSRQWFHVHRAKCMGDSCMQPSSVPAAVYYSPNDVTEQFKTRILSKFLRDQVGSFCVKDATMRYIGSKLYAKIRSRQEKSSEVRKGVMADMRRLGTLFFHFKSACCEAVRKDPGRIVAASDDNVCLTDMFIRTNFDILESACVAQTSGEGEAQKSALMMSLYYLLIKCAKIIRVRFLTRNKDIEASQTMEFLEVLREEKHTLIGSAIYVTNKNRNTRLRRPQELPKEEHMATLRQYIIERVQSLCADQFVVWTSNEFVELRDLTCSRLTLFNGRRGK